MGFSGNDSEIRKKISKKRCPLGNIKILPKRGYGDVDYLVIIIYWDFLYARIDTTILPLDCNGWQRAKALSPRGINNRVDPIAKRRYSK